MFVRMGATACKNFVYRDLHSLQVKGANMKTYLDVELYHYYYYKYIMRMYIKNWKFGGRRRQGADAARVIFQL